MSCLYPVWQFSCCTQTYFTSLKWHSAQRLPKRCKSSEEEARLAKRSQELWPAGKHVSCQWGLEETFTSICSFVKGEQSSESLKGKGWDSYTSLPWEKAHLSCWSSLYAPGYQISNTLSIKRRERSRRVSRGVCLVQRRGQKKLCRFL